MDGKMLVQYQYRTSVADPGCFIPDPDLTIAPSQIWIPDPDCWYTYLIQKALKGKSNCLLAIFTPRWLDYGLAL
jgi:hypothetical protein